MIDEKAEPWRYNFFIANNYYHDAVNIASRFWDADPKCDFALLASVWHSKNDFGRKLDEVFTVKNILEASKKPNFEVGEVARVIHATYLGYLADRERMKSGPIIITPPTPIPPPPMPPPVAVEKPKLPEVKLPQEPKPPTKTPWKLIATILAGVSLVLKFTPVPAIVILIVDWLVKLIAAIPQ